jgi:hypothetical protein
MIFQHGLPPVVGDTAFTLQERKALSNQGVVVDRILPVDIMEELNLI